MNSVKSLFADVSPRPLTSCGILISGTIMSSFLAFHVLKHDMDQTPADRGNVIEEYQNRLTQLNDERSVRTFARSLYTDERVNEQSFRTISRALYNHVQHDSQARQNYRDMITSRHAGSIDECRAEANGYRGIYNCAERNLINAGMGLTLWGPLGGLGLFSFYLGVCSVLSRLNIQPQKPVPKYNPKNH